ncbi:hypothetical protein ACHAP7_009534 [Fusarium lateritium]
MAVLDLLGPRPVLASVSLVFVYILGTILFKFYIVRSRLRNLPQPPGHSFIWGHLGTFLELYKTVPARCAAQTSLYSIKEKYNLGDAFYVDLWPARFTILVLNNPDMFNQVALKPSLPKHPTVGNFLSTLVDPAHSIVTQEGNNWKTWRSAFNPGFSPSHMLTFVPAIVEEVQVFVSLLEQNATQNNLFRMERYSTRLTLDIIGRLVMDERFQCQTSANPFIDAFESLVKQLSTSNLPNIAEALNLKRTLSIRRNRHIMDRYISEGLEKRFATRNTREKQKLVIDLALESYLKEERKLNDTQQVKSLDPTFKKVAIAQIKTFLFAGHDTTSSTICYAYYHLSKSPECLQSLREELDQVLGTDWNVAADLISHNPTILSRLVYTTAVLKETLRLCPPASSLRQGQKGHFVHDPRTGESFPTEGCLVWPISTGIHRHAATWGDDAHLFKPERFLSDKDNAAKTDGYVPFSRGPRNCIGQDLAMTESKIILALTVRQFDFKPAFDELLKLKDDGTGYPSDTDGPQTQFGDEAYQIQLGAAKPREGMPCRMSLRKHSV